MAGLGLNQDQLSVLLGGIGKAIMAPTKDGAQSWQSGIGQLAGDMGSAKILADQANKQRAEQRALIQMLMGGGGQQTTPFTTPTLNQPQMSNMTLKGGLTPEGVPGDTTQTFQMNADGTYKKTSTGNSPMPGVNAPVASAPKTKGFSLKDILPF